MLKYIKLAFGLSLILFLSCSKESNTAGSPAETGKGGSLARFTIASNHLYLVDYWALKVFDLSNPSNPVEKSPVNVGFGIETVFPYKDKLFIGSRDGMFIYSISDPSNPVLLGRVQHLRSCDPVVANDTVSYVTLQGGPCGPAESGLYIYDIKTLTSPILKKLLPMSSPFGLGLKDSVVFVCRGNAGLTAVDVKNPTDPKVLYTRTGAFFQDVIPYDNLLICFIERGIMIYDASNLKNIVKIGEVSN